MKFQPGQSGNPSGRPKIPEEVKQQMKMGAAEGVAFWLNTLRDENASWANRDRAAEKLVAYGYGKPRESVDIELAGNLVVEPATFVYVDPPKTGNASTEEV